MIPPARSSEPNPGRPASGTKTGEAGSLAGSAGKLVRYGIAASGGLSAGPAHLIYPEEIQAEDRPLLEGEEKQQIRRFRVAVRRSRDEIQALKECLTTDPEDAGLRVLDAHRMILEDPELLQSVIDGIRKERRPAAIMLRKVLQRMISALESADTEYFRARAADIRDVKRRVIRHLEGVSTSRGAVPRGAIIVAIELSPSEAASFDPDHVRGLVTDQGGATGHAAILARSRGIPAVVGLGDLFGKLSENDAILVDGNRGRIVVRPDEEELREFDALRRRQLRRARQLARQDTEPAVTLDSHPISLLANVETPVDVGDVMRGGAVGIGLFRTEFFFLGDGDLPDEEGQYKTYRRVLRRLRPRPVTIRTLDVGGDKFASYLGTTRSDNPFLGVRGIRFLLQHRDVLRTQIRAIFRASAYGNAQILFPMISALDEVREVNALCDEVWRDLQVEGHRLGERVPRGVMIEVPAAVTLADFLARETDFFSIGSNDLIQYILAVDRGNQKVAYLYDPFHPAVIRGLASTIEAANRARVPVSSCGEMSGNPYGAAVLLGLGCRHLSMSPIQIREVKAMIRKVRLVDLRSMSEELLRQPTADHVRRVLTATLGSILKDGGAGMMAPDPKGRGESVEESSSSQGSIN